MHTKTSRTVLAPLAEAVLELIVAVADPDNTNVGDLAVLGVAIDAQVRNLVAIGSRLVAQPTADDILKRDMPSCLSVSGSSENMVSSLSQLAREPFSPHHRTTVMDSLKGIMEGTTRLLSVFDDADVRRIAETCRDLARQADAVETHFCSAAGAASATAAAGPPAVHLVAMYAQTALALAQMTIKRVAELLNPALQARLRAAVDALAWESPCLVSCCRVAAVAGAEVLPEARSLVRVGCVRVREVCREIQSAVEADGLADETRAALESGKDEGLGNARALRSLMVEAAWIKSAASSGDQKEVQNALAGFSHKSITFVASEIRSIGGILSASRHQSELVNMLEALAASIPKIVSSAKQAVVRQENMRAQSDLLQALDAVITKMRKYQSNRSFALIGDIASSIIVLLEKRIAGCPYAQIVELVSKSIAPSHGAPSPSPPGPPTDNSPGSSQSKGTSKYAAGSHGAAPTTPSSAPAAAQQNPSPHHHRPGISAQLDVFLSEARRLAKMTGLAAATIATTEPETALEVLLLRDRMVGIAPQFTAAALAVVVTSACGGSASPGFSGVGSPGAEPPATSAGGVGSGGGGHAPFAAALEHFGRVCDGWETCLREMRRVLIEEEGAFDRYELVSGTRCAFEAHCEKAVEFLRNSTTTAETSVRETATAIAAAVHFVTLIGREALPADDVAYSASLETRIRDVERVLTQLAARGRSFLDGRKTHTNDLNDFETFAQDLASKFSAIAEIVRIHCGVWTDRTVAADETSLLQNTQLAIQGVSVEVLERALNDFALVDGPPPQLLGEAEAEASPIEAAAREILVSASRWSANGNPIISGACAISERLAALSDASKTLTAAAASSSAKGGGVASTARKLIKTAKEMTRDIERVASAAAALVSLAAARPETQGDGSGAPSLTENGGGGASSLGWPRGPDRGHVRVLLLAGAADRLDNLAQELKILAASRVLFGIDGGGHREREERLVSWSNRVSRAVQSCVNEAERVGNSVGKKFKRNAFRSKRQVEY
ncbi:Vinculin family-domain-containing protein [Zopfochytrium polystomum]|nr:Vinculin family-domain-containing protein [Zopfochytrium polystomum]